MTCSKLFLWMMIDNHELCASSSGESSSSSLPVYDEVVTKGRRTVSPSDVAAQSQSWFLDPHRGLKDAACGS